MPYIKQVGEQLGTDDVSEIVNQIILDQKRVSPHWPHQNALTAPKDETEVLAPSTISCFVCLDLGWIAETTFMPRFGWTARRKDCPHCQEQPTTHLTP